MRKINLRIRIRMPRNLRIQIQNLAEYLTLKQFLRTVSGRIRTFLVGSGSGNLGTDSVQDVDLAPDQDPRIQKCQKIHRPFEQCGVKCLHTNLNNAVSGSVIGRFEKSDQDPNSSKLHLNWHCRKKCSQKIVN
jgi:hypothetical protein